MTGDVSSDAAGYAPEARNHDVSEQSANQERLFNQDEVTDIVKKVKADAVDTYKRLVREQPEYAKQKYGDIPTAPAKESSLSPEQLQRMVADEAKKHIAAMQEAAFKVKQEEAANQTVETFYNKMLSGKEKYTDFEAALGDLELSNYPNVIRACANVIDNADDVMYELSQNRLKLIGLENAFATSPNDAIREMKRLSKSIKDNAEALKSKQPKPPLGQLRSSNQGTSSGGAMTAAEARRAFRGKV